MYNFYLDTTKGLIKQVKMLSVFIKYLQWKLSGIGYIWENKIR